MPGADSSARDLDFPEEEFRGRVARAQRSMDDQGIGALFLSHTDNIFYFTGYRSQLKISQHRPFAAVLPARGDPTLILPSFEIGNANLKSWVEDVRLWGAGDDYVRLYRDVLRQAGATGATIGIELGDDMWLGLPGYQWNRLQAALPEARFVSSADLIWQLRSVKSPMEVECLRRAARITDLSVAAAWDALRPGVTERHIASAISTTMLAGGADSLVFVIVKSGFGPHRASNKYATERVVQPGDIVTLDIGCFYRGYASDMQRSACLGRPAPEHHALEELALALNRACLAEVRAGVPIKTVDEARVRFLQESGHPVPLYAGVGHSLGIAVHELPRIGPEGEGALQAGNVLAVEPSVQASRWGSICIEDMVVVTETGYQFLTESPRELMIKE